MSFNVIKKCFGELCEPYLLLFNLIYLYLFQVSYLKYIYLYLYLFQVSYLKYIYLIS